MELGAILAALIGAGAGAGGVFVVNQRKGAAGAAKAKQMIAEAKNKAKGIEIDAKDRALKITDEATKEGQKRRKELDTIQARIAERETSLDKKLEDLDARGEKMRKDETELEALKRDIQEIRTQQLTKLEKVASLSKKRRG